jgi:DNA-binding response OmpR family regulator
VARVLVIEDEESLGGVLADLLADEGYEVRWVRNGRDGLRALQEWRPSVVLLDLMMPVLDGWGFRAAQRRLRSDLAGVPVVVLSAARQARAEAQRLDAAAAIPKPFDLEQIPTTIAQVLQRHP